MRKFIVSVIAGLILIPVANAAKNESINFGSVKCTVANISECRTKTVTFNVFQIVDEYEVTGNLVLVSASQTNATVALVSDGNKKLSGSLYVKNNGTVLATFNFSGVG